MIIEISGRTYSGRTSSVVKLLDTSKKTFIHTLDGDFEHVYHRVTGKLIGEDFTNLTISIGQIVEFEENKWFGKVDDTVIKNFIEADADVLVMDIQLPSTYLGGLKDKFHTYYPEKTLILVHHKSNGFNFKDETNKV